MPVHRTSLPQLQNTMFLTDGGLETDLIFNRHIDVPAFAAHTLLATDEGRRELTRYYSEYLALAAQAGLGFVLDVPTWRAQRFFAEELNCEPGDLQRINEDAVAFSAALRREFSDSQQPIVLNALLGPRGDAYAPTSWMTAEQSMRYHSEQLGWLAATDVDMVSALTLTYPAEAIGIVRAAQHVSLPIAVSFTVETDGRLPNGQGLADAIEEVDAATNSGAAYFMLNCAHPSHFLQALDHDVIKRRVYGLRCNASALSHAELDCCEVLDSGDPIALAADYEIVAEALPRLRVVGGCCGTDIRHVRQIASSLAA